MTVENSAGSVDYLDKTIQSGHSVDDILEQFNTSRYIPSDFSAANGSQYTINADGEYTEDVWLKMATGQTLTVTYNNLNGTSFNGTPVKKIVATYTLVETPSTDGSAIVKLYHDPTKTLFIGSQTDDTNKKLHVKMNLNFFDSESSVTPLDLSKNGSVLSISSLNHWNTELGNHIEKVGLNGNEYVQIPGSSITLHEDGYAYATNDNEFVANGSRFNSDPTVDPTTGEVTDEGWDAINPDGTPRTKNAYYGAAATIFKGEPMDFIVSGNNLNVPTAYWFATNSTVVVPELPEEPNKPVLPNTVSAKVTYHKNFVSVEETTEKPKPQVPTTPAEPTPGKPVTSTSVPVIPTSVPVKEEAPTLPATGEKSTAASVAAGAAMVTSALALFGISTYKRKH